MQENFKRGGTALNIEKLKNDKNSQDFILMKGMYQLLEEIKKNSIYLIMRGLYAK